MTGGVGFGCCIVLILSSLFDAVQLLCWPCNMNFQSLNNNPPPLILFVLNSIILTLDGIRVDESDQWSANTVPREIDCVLFSVTIRLFV